MKNKVLAIEYMPIDELRPYENNAKIHTPEQIEQIKNSIKDFGMIDPIGIWSEKNIIVEGHGRLIACKELGLDKVPVIRLDELTDEERKAYTLAHNQLTMSTGFDMEKLTQELKDIDLDLDSYGLGEVDLGIDLGGLDDEPDETYTKKIDVPQYEITGEKPELSELVDTTKADELLAEIAEAELPDDIRAFLQMAASRHYVFNYKDIAEYYAHAEPAVQELMEKSALVIIDYDDAIKNGFCKLNDELIRLEAEDNEG